MKRPADGASMNRRFRAQDRNMRRIFAALLWTVPVVSATAGESEVALGSGLYYRQLEEFGRDGDRLLTESGAAPGIGLELSVAAGPGALIGGFGVSGYRLDYDGRSQQGRAVDSHSDYRERHLWAGYRFDLGNRWSLGLRWQRNQVERDIRGTETIAGLREQTLGNRAAVGLRHRLADGPVEWIEARWHRTLGGTLRVDSPGLVDRVWIPLGASRGFSVSARIPLGTMGGFRRIDLEPGFSRTHTDASETRAWTRDGVVQGRIGQPERVEWQLGAGLRLSW